MKSIWFYQGSASTLAWDSLGVCPWWCLHCLHSVFMDWDRAHRWGKQQELSPWKCPSFKAWNCPEIHSKLFLNRLWMGKCVLSAVGCELLLPWPAGEDGEAVDLAALKIFVASILTKKNRISYSFSLYKGTVIAKKSKQLDLLEINFMVIQFHFVWTHLFLFFYLIQTFVQSNWTRSNAQKGKEMQGQVLRPSLLFPEQLACTNA